MADTARVTVTLAADLVEDIDRLERNRSRFIAEAVRRELTRRRQAALLRSIRSPHAETVALVDTGLADWVSDLPADEGLVDVEAGTPVRWVEGKGWKKGLTLAACWQEPILVAHWHQHKDLARSGREASHVVD